MSLHLGNLSSRIHRDELERVFRRFGRCNVRVKDKFGFVVYDYPINAEKALKTLRGKFICGERITLSWSKQQPRPMQKHAQGVKSVEAVRGRHSATENYVDREVGLNGRQGYRKDFRQGNGDQRLGSADIVHDAYHENMKDYEEHHPLVDDFPSHGGGVVANLSEIDRWPEPVFDPMSENVPEDGSEFDRYEPNEADEPLRKPEGKAGMEKIEQITLNLPNNSKTQNACYNCGEAGHKMRKCPQVHKRLESRNARKLRAGCDTESLRMVEGTREATDSRYDHRLRIEPSPLSRMPDSGGRKDYRGKKRSWKEHGSPEKYHSKKVRVPISSSIHSDYTAIRSRSSSRSLRSFSRSLSASRSKSVSSRKGSPSSSSQSGSAAPRATSKSFKPNLKSRSSSPTSLSVSVSLGQPLPSSPNKVQIDQKASMVDAHDPQSKEVLFEGEPLGNSDSKSSDPNCENIKVKVEKESEAAPCELEKNVEDDYSQRRNEIHTGRDSCQGKGSNTPGFDTEDPAASSVSLQSLTRELQNGDLVTEQTWATNQNPTLQVSERLHAANLTSLSSEEVYRILKHYGLENQEEREIGLPVETYFGCGRLWPWEIIYYRRLKKGPISTKNYSRRLAQNKEFGIVDKFVRSSSGWGELGEEDCDCFL